MSDTILSNSIWPNGMKTDAEGYARFYPLGDNKTPMPTSSSDWPKGNKLISPFVYQDDKLVGFCDTKAMTTNSGATITMPYEYIEADFSSIKEGTVTIDAPNATTKKFTWAVVPTSDVSFDYIIVDFTTTDQDTIIVVRSAYGVVDKTIYDIDGNAIGTWDTSKLEVGGVYDMENGNLDGLYYNYDKNTYTERGIILTEFDSDLSSLTDGTHMFCKCYNLSTFNSDLSSLTDGRNMFDSCSNLTTFTSDLSSLTDGRSMFNNCKNLTTFNCNNLSSLTTGSMMFSVCHNLTTFTSDLSSLTNGSNMFNECYELETFNADLSSLTNGRSMFYYCSNLTTFTSDLSSLTNGIGMFYECKLENFTSDLSSLTNGSQMFYGCKLDVASVQNIAENINTVTNSPSLDIGIGRGAATAEDEVAFQTIRDKGWELYVEYNPSTTSEASAVATLDETDETQTIPTVFWAKPVPSDEEHARYIDGEGNYYNILGGNLIYVSDPDTYGMFLNEEDAAM